MHHHLLFVMSLSGSAVVALYALLYPIIKRYVSISWQKNILKFAIFFYLFPFPLFKEAVVSFIYDLLPALVINNLDVPEGGTLDLNYAINLQPGNIFWGPEVLLMGAFVCCMGTITFFIIAKKIWQYLATSRTYLSASFSEAPPLSLAEQFHQMKTEMKIKRNIRLVCSQFCKSPITIGVFAPTIILPSADVFQLKPLYYTYILKHELVQSGLLLFVS